MSVLIMNNIGTQLTIFDIPKKVETKLPDATSKYWQAGLMRYIRNDRGYYVADEGLITISGVRHYVHKGFVFCNSSLNRRAWLHNPAVEICEKCRVSNPDKF